jgi:hypothetical protein
MKEKKQLERADRRREESEARNEGHESINRAQRKNVIEGREHPVDLFGMLINPG